MTLKAFRSQVLAALRNEPEGKDLSDEELLQAVDDYADIVEGSYEDSQEPGSYGEEWHIKNAAQNIAMCI